MKQAFFSEPLIFELGGRGRIGELIEDVKVEIPKELMREELNLPELSQIEVVRHFTRLSQMNWGVDLGPYPLGSCTMKYNPRINEDLAWLDEVQWLHPLQNEVQGILELMYKLEKILASITGMDRFTFQPAAGASGELTGCLIIRKYHKDRGENRDEIIVPDSAHGTNPASAAMAGFKIIEVRTNEEGQIDIEELKSAVGNRTAGLMMTNPNTLGIFEKQAKEISEIIHDAGGLMYYDGANLQGIIGFARPGDFGFDIVHLNLHKTFSTPHGGGGPGSGPVGVKKFLEEYLPIPIVDFNGEKYYLKWDLKKTIGKIKDWYGNIPVLVRAYAYLLSMGKEGLKLSCKAAVVNTNYFMKKVSKIKGITIPFGNSYRKHEVVISVENMAKETGVTAMDVAKALLDRGLHAPTIYFPLIVKEALMFEFTDTETKENIDKYIEALKEISELAYSNPELIKNAPINTSVSRLDEVYANHPKTMCLSYRMLKYKQ
ncbi:MAG: aminomethyl-transferring glycine dehydrogenase subunit GcvPB [Candidatus Methanomethyliaceae archaeon]|nr:aminomethyl-transferring glycine dehydrogenase subunit GcvPB [Candidatus Methanomethyliaceae archaeon]MDW7971426.1 aminomethyl-transferring glycine dehydrogenase subunit GcvPB [Nitrososphaerota archaeon]